MVETARRTIGLARRQLLKAVSGVAAWMSAGRLLAPRPALADHGDIQKINLSEAEWRMRLTEPAFAVLRKAKTEAPFSSPLNDEKRAGTFMCAGCRLPIFRSEAKFDSGTGWPSFTAAISGHVETKRDFLLLLPRTEYHCARCGGHQGHIFDDGPPPTGKRYCNNGVALDFVAGS